eukprot:TRINITY_DN44293_c0_g1_i1.p1 TRINITY_DN44293_c0_g1~~TRINITY_DN44293_c0_g1_i1.p1  ORF type:complete len:470 (+),score=145.78 TRINITY_DN44293_c0_g1_i1:112-1521(+)
MGNRASTAVEEEDASDCSTEDLGAFLAQDVSEDEAPQATKAADKPVTRAKSAAPKKKFTPVMAPAAVAAAAKAAKAAKEAKVNKVAVQINAFHEQEREKAQREADAASGRNAGAADPSDPNADPRDLPLPRGDVGTVWEALEDSIVREGKDVKSAKVGGAIQAGEQCTQTGPWKADNGGRVRMPVKGPRGLEGWVTVDERRCQNSLDRSFGNLCFKLAPEASSVAHAAPTKKTTSGAKEEEAKPSKASTEEALEDDPLLDFLVTGAEEHEAVRREEEAKESDKIAHKQSIAEEAAARGLSVRAYRREVAAQKSGRPLEDGEATVAQQSMENGQAIVAPPAEPELQGVALTDAQKRLRAVQKKLRDVELLEEKLGKAGRGSATAEQLSKLERGPELRELVAEAEAEVAAEAKEAAAAAGKKKKKKSTTAADKKKKKGAKEDTASGACGGMTFAAAGVVAVAALAAGVYFR